MSTHNRAKALLPNMLTCANLLFGVGAMFLMVQARESGAAGDVLFNAAAWLMVLAAIMDGLDGKLARKMGTSSEFGVQFDSLADLTTFCITPAMLLYTRYIGTTKSFLIIVPLFFVVAGTFRLARFNATVGGKKKTHFVGMPSTTGGPLLAGYVLLISFFQSHGISIHQTQVALFGLLLGTFNGILMVSSVPFATSPPLFFRALNKPGRIMVVILFVGGMIRYVGPTVMILGFLYTVESLIVGFHRMRSSHKTDALQDDSDELYQEFEVFDEDEEEDPVAHHPL